MINIAIDGPAGAGKSTIAKAVAAKLGYVYVDTGALYRAVGLYAITNNVGVKDEEGLKKLLADAVVDIRYIDGAQRVFLNDEDVSEKIRTPEISMAASDVSGVPYVREFLFDLQRNIAKSNNSIMDGRDIGTVVLPNADLKIFLTASNEERAKRRYDELIEKGQSVKYEDVLADVIQRDYNDTHRKISPLKQAEDAICVDTSGNTLEQSIDAIIQLVKEKIGE